MPLFWKVARADTSPVLVDSHGKIAKGRVLYVYLIKRYLKAFLREDSQREQLEDAILALEMEAARSRLKL